MDLRANPVPKGLALALVVMAIAVSMKACRREAPTDPQAMKTIPKAPPPDADTPADTIRTLQATVAEMNNKFGAMSQENLRLLDANRNLEHRLGELQGQVTDRSNFKAQAESAMSVLTHRIDELSGNVSSLRERGTNTVVTATGLRGNPDAIAWIEPVGSLAAIAETNKTKATDTPATPTKPPLKPVYTLAENMALTGSTAFTALVGRIPIRGNVQDPYPFYVLVGPDNLAANGMELPEVAGMIFRGTALGDWSLSCVRGRLLSVTFIFRNGTLRTVRGTEQDPLGELADQFGVPCVSGKRISNAAAYLSQRVLVSAVGAAGDAAAASQTTTSVSAIGGTGTTAVTGQIGKFILGRTVRESARDVEQWLDRRYGDAFDAIFAAPGNAVSLLIQKEITVDYDPVGRKLRHASVQLDMRPRKALD
jgi:hypothetical protein